jgi:glutamate N-acetyltransferase/amino-acid N-acetyltransferase
VTEFSVPRGFTLSAVAAGIKETKKDRLDLGLILSDRPANTAAVFTRNAFPAAPVVLSRANLEKTGHTARAVLVNSGNANAATGEAGMAAARSSIERVAARVGCSAAEIFVSSTGVIGRTFPVDRLCEAVPELISKASATNVEGFARAIMTTDTVPKIASAEVGGARILGFAKGAGMIHPNMATMLAFVMTDARIDPAVLDGALRESVDRSFHSITVDGDTSTNDVVVVLANGASGYSPTAGEFTEKLQSVCEQLAKSIVRDGEGATKFVELVIEGAPSEAAAREIGRCIARSPLVKTAIYGSDPNWGRLICAIGNSGVPLTSDQIEIYIGDIPLRDGDLKLASERMKAKEIVIRIVLHSGSGSARVWTCDLTEEYIHINADYTT